MRERLKEGRTCDESVSSTTLYISLTFVRLPVFIPHFSSAPGVMAYSCDKLLSHSVNYLLSNAVLSPAGLIKGTYYFLYVFSSPVSLLIPQYRYMEHCVDRINEELLWKQVDVVLCVVTCAVIVTCRGVLYNRFS